MKILLKNGKPLMQDGKVLLSSTNNSGSNEPGAAYEDLLEIIGTKADVAYVEQVRQEIYDKYDNTTAGPTPASQVMFDDGVSLAEKYINGELGTGGGGVDDDIILTTTTPSSIACGKDDVITINYNFSREVQTTRAGNERVYVDGILYSTKSISQGNNVVIINGLTSGTHTIEIQITSGSLSSSLVYTAEVVELSISSTFDGFAIYTNPITYRYTPIGNVEKTMHFVIDEEEYTQVVNESNKAMTYQFETLSHGSHKVSVYATAKVGTEDVSSNVLTYDLVVNNGGTETIIGCPFSITKATQGDLLQFNYVVFTPNSLTSEVSLKINGEEISNLTVDRTQQTWSLRDYPTGNIVCSIESGNTSVSFEIEVSASDVKVEAITHNLELHLSSAGRSNNENESTRDVWENNGVVVTFNNFNWQSNGWNEDDEHNSVLRINGDARITIPFKIFANDFRSIGKTIEFEFATHDVRDYDSILINCLSNGRGFSLTSNIARLHSVQTKIETKFKEDEKVRVSFVIEPISENRLIYTYVNGVLSGLIQYPANDNFSQSNPVGITVGSNDATIDLYNIRVYNINLDHSDILTNFIADTPDRVTKFNLFNNNDIFDTYGNIDYNKVVTRIPCLTFVGDLPATKGDKKIVSVKYINNFDSSKNFDSYGVTLDIQGTSSQYYPRKNYKFKLPNVYKLTNDSIPETVFCLKADYMESSHSHNTGLAKIVNTLYPTTPASQANNKVQAAITGFPIVVWYKENENATVKCLGVYNFNNDKDDTTTFGYTSEFPNCESWEFKNNTSAHCLFQNSNFVDTVEVAKNFEARYPDKYTNYTNLSRVVSWVASTEGNLEKFKNEFNNYFNLEATLLYYCLTELFAMVDSRAKNLFLTTWDGNIWYPTFYDMDTAFGLNNEGKNVNNYNVEYHDIIGTKNAFNGESSVLWNNFEQVYEDEIQEFYNNLRNNKLVTYDTVMSILYEQQISKICESNYNYDSVEKYKNPLVNEGDGTYIYCAQGNRLDHLKWWLYNRINYMDSKYVASDYKNNYITLRIYTPEVYGSVVPNADAHITPYADQYITVKYDENMFNERGTHDVETVIEAPNQIFNDTPMIIYGASRISDIGDLSPLYAGTVDVSKGIKLKQLIIGNSASDYRNTNLEELSIGNNELLTKLDVSNCPSLTQTIDLGGCTNVEEIYAKGTSTTAVKVPNGGNLKVLHLPSTITNLTILNQPFITDFQSESFSKINTLRIENTPIDTLSIVQGAINSLERVRLTNVNWTLNDSTVLEKLMTLKGLNENGVSTDKPVLTGKIHVRGKVSSSLIKECAAIFGSNLIVTVDSIQLNYKCEFYNYDGTLLETVAVDQGKYATYSGATPIRQDEDIYYYEFNGWSPSISNAIQANTKFVAQYIKRRYTIVKWLNWDGTQLQRNLIKPSEVVSFTGVATKPDDEHYTDYMLSGWVDNDGEFYDTGIALTSTQDITLTAQFIGTPRPFTVNWYSSDGTVLLSTETYSYGSVANYSGETPTGEGIFKGWSLTPNGALLEDLTVTGDMNFYAILTRGTRIYLTNMTNITDRPFLYLQSDKYPVSFNVDWGDGNIEPYTLSNSARATIYKANPYASQGDYVIEIDPNENINMQYGFQSSDLVPAFATKIEFTHGIKKISALACGKFKKLATVIIPEGVTKIENNAFSDCISLTSITIPESVISIGRYAFDGSGLTSITLNASYLAEYAFLDCEQLTDVTILSNVSIISEKVFLGCINLTNITVDPNNTVYDSRDNCNAIIETSTNTLVLGCQNTIIPESVTGIGNNAYYGYKYLTELTIPNHITSIGEYAFASCSELTKITIPESVTSIGNAAFCYLSKLTNITVDPNNTVYDSRDNCNAIIETSTNTLVLGCQNTIIPESVTGIGNNAYYGYKYLTELTIPNHITSIGEYAFAECSKLSKITIPASVTSIGGWAFHVGVISTYVLVTMESETPPTIGQSIFRNPNYVSIKVPTAEAYEAYIAATNWSEYANRISYNQEV